MLVTRVTMPGISWYARGTRASRWGNLGQVRADSYCPKDPGMNILYIDLAVGGILISMEGATSMSLPFFRLAKQLPDSWLKLGFGWVQWSALNILQL